MPHAPWNIMLTCCCCIGPRSPSRLANLNINVNGTCHCCDGCCHYWQACLTAYSKERAQHEQCARLVLDQSLSCHTLCNEGSVPLWSDAARCLDDTLPCCLCWAVYAAGRCLCILLQACCLLHVLVAR